jgi:hypothetical protein
MTPKRLLRQIPLDYARCAGKADVVICGRREHCARFTDRRIQPTTHWGCVIADNFIDNAAGETA